MTKPAAPFLLSGFVLTMVLRLLTSSLLILIPLSISVGQGVGAAYAGLYIVLLWVGNAAGVLGSVAVVRRHSAASVLGFALLALALFGLALSMGEGTVAALTLLAGAGMGMAQPFLSALMHLDSGAENPFRGIGYYSVALGAGLVAGPLLASVLLASRGFAIVFASLGSLSLLALAVALARRRSVEGIPLQETAVHALSLSQIYGALKVRRFAKSLTLNFLYSLLLPVFLSFGAIYGEAKFGIGPSEALLMFTGVFILSTAVRIAVVRSPRRLDLHLLAAMALLLSSVVVVALAQSAPEFLIGMLLFGAPHALVHPITNFEALDSMDGSAVVNASYAFQASSGAAEVISPAVAVVAISSLGLPSLFAAASPVALLALLLAGLWSVGGPRPGAKR